jgi:predicted Zn-dependent protease
VTGVAGHVAEPYLDATIRPNALFPAYLSGFNLAESYYLAMPFVSWQTVVVGDPLCAPFPRKTLQPSDIDKGIDPATELPAQFSSRRMQSAAMRSLAPEVGRLLLRAEARNGKGDKPGALKALEEATAIETKLPTAHLALAQSYEESKEYDKAIDRYRKLLAINPNDTISLNNLAYALAVRKGQPAEALGYAERAFTLTRGNATVADTLAWVRHLLGRDQEAAQIMPAIVKAVPQSGEIRMHAAVIYAAVGMLEPAAKELAEALRLDATLAQSDEAKALQGKLGKK